MLPFLIDTHTHVNFDAFNDDRSAVIKRSLAEKIWLIGVGTQYSTSCQAVKYAEEYKEGVYAAVGIHPTHVHQDSLEQDKQKESQELEIFDLVKYEKLLQNPKTVALGEVGLDYGEGISLEAQEKQKKVLLEQIKLVQKFNKPIIFHCRKAYNDLIEILTSAKKKYPELRGVIHCFMGRWSQAERFLEMDFHLGFNGLITYARDYDKVIKNLPLEKILLETDCPYLTPIPHRGKRNEPLYVKHVAEKIAQVREDSFAKIAQQTTKNARQLFNI